MKKIFFLISIVIVIHACKTDNPVENKKTSSDIHKALISEVLQTGQYTYLQVKEGISSSWLALPKMEARIGETYYYKDGMHMTDFVSKELNRTFKDILFLDKLSISPENLTEQITKEEQPLMETSESSNEDRMQASVTHQIEAIEVLQTKKYTYIKGMEGGEEIWIAVAKMDAGVGQTYYFTRGLKMTDFPSKELKRTFKEILFVDQIATQASSFEKNTEAIRAEKQMISKGSSIDIEKKEVKIKRKNREITISSLLKNKDTYSGKTIKIKGQVVKFSPGIMKRNWIHLQDGTENSGKFDLTVCTEETVKTGDVISVEGIITLNKDFGFGYFYEVIMENATIINR